MPIFSPRRSLAALLCAATFVPTAMAQSAQPRAVFAAHVDATGKVVAGTDWIERVDVVLGEYRPSFYTVRLLPGVFVVAPICSVSLIHETDLQDVIDNVATLKTQPTPYEVLVRIAATRNSGNDHDLLNRQAFDLVCFSASGVHR
jgi:hypothetical protein